jgi:predicted MFS family arabinose efflux permease
MREKNNFSGAFVLCVNHLAGFVDLVILPIWVGVLVQYYKNSPQQAGAIVSLFLVGQVIASLILSTRFDRINKRYLVASVGYVLASVCMFFLVQTTTFTAMALLHFIAGLSVGVGLSVTDGTIGNSENPHRLFAIASLSLGMFAILFYVVVNPIIIKHGGSILFYFISILMFISFLSTLVAFPNYGKTERKLAYEATVGINNGKHDKIPTIVWFVIAGLMGMAMITAMASSYYERFGIASGYSPEKVNMILLINGIILLTPSICAAFLQKYIKVRTVAAAGIIFQAVVVILIYTSKTFLVYALPAWGVGFAAVFVHTFLFGYLAHMDPSGRVVAANPAVMMTGSMLGPFIGGTLVQYIGYQSLAGFVTVWNALILFICFWRIKEVDSSPLIVNAPDQVADGLEKGS